MEAWRPRIDPNHSFLNIGETHPARGVTDAFRMALACVPREVLEELDLNCKISAHETEIETPYGRVPFDQGLPGLREEEARNQALVCIARVMAVLRKKDLNLTRAEWDKLRTELGQWLESGETGQDLDSMKLT